MVPELRISARNEGSIRPDGDYVLYWMIAARRTSWNFALDRAREHADALRKPIVILEALRLDYPWASDRLHGFALDGMRDNLRACRSRQVLYYPYVEPSRGEGKGLVSALAERACVVVTDDFPGFFLDEMVTAASRRILVRIEAVDSNGLLPLRAVESAFPSTYAFRRALQYALPAHVGERPTRDPLRQMPASSLVLPIDVRSRWPDATEWLHTGNTATLAIDHRVAPTEMRGGECAARTRLRAFVAAGLDSYGTERNHFAGDDTSSRLSPYLHWGHLSVHEVFDAATSREDWLGPASPKAAGAQKFLDRLIVWRELGYNTAAKRDDHDRFDSLPSWALNTLKKHQADERQPLYTLAVFEEARTHDPLWNAAQRQLVSEGRIQNDLRMLWGKKILAWSATPREALRIMIDLNNKYALDGRDPNSYSGIFWVLGRYDRPWWPERPIFGAVRYMSSEDAARKLRVGEYIRRYGEL